LILFIIFDVKYICMINEIIIMFQNLTPILWVSQICGLIGFLIIGISYQLNRKNFLLFCSISCFFFVLEQIFAGLYENAITSALSGIRNIIILLYLVKKNRQMPNIFTHVFVLISFVFALVSFIRKGYKAELIIECFLPFVIYAIGTYSVNLKNYLLLKVGMFFNEGGYLIYYIIYHLPFSILRQVVLTSSVLISIIVYLIKLYKSKKEVKINE